MKVCTITLLLGIPCSGYSQSPSYTHLIQQALDKQAPLCLGEVKWPQSRDQDDSIWVYAKMSALYDAGLITDKRTSLIRQWSLTKMGEKEYRKHGDFCFGKMRIDKIKQIIHHKYGGVSVIFDYRIDNLAEWAKNPLIRSAYSSLDNLVGGVKDARYQADFSLDAAGIMIMIGEPYQLDLFY